MGVAYDVAITNSRILECRTKTHNSWVMGADMIWNYDRSVLDWRCAFLCFYAHFLFLAAFLLVLSTT